MYFSIKNTLKNNIFRWVENDVKLSVHIEMKRKLAR